MEESSGVAWILSHCSLAAACGRLVALNIEVRRRPSDFTDMLKRKRNVRLDRGRDRTDGGGERRKDAMSEQFLWPILSVVAPLVIASVVAYVLLNRQDGHSHRKH